MKYFHPLVLILAMCIFAAAQGQERDGDLVQFSGVVVTNDSLIPLPYTTVIIKNTSRGTISDYYGFFSFVARVNDTIQFSAVGFKKTTFVIPDTLNENRYSIIQMMSRDTVQLRETVIYPWPSKEQFKEAFLKMRLPDDDMARAKRNLARAEMKARGKAMPMDGSMNFKNAMQTEYTRVYHAGQLPPNNLLNPLAWASFIKAWKNGEFKRKEYDKDE